MAGMRYQPQGLLRINRDNPITRTLSYASAVGAGGPDIATTVGSITKTVGRSGIADAMSPGNYKVARNPKVGTAAKGTIVVAHNSTVLPPSGPTYSHVLASTAPSGSQNCLLLMLGNGNGWLQFRVYGGTTGTADGAADTTLVLNDGKPHVTVATYDMAAGGALATYVDNVNTSSGTHPTAITQSANLTIGHSRDTFWGDFQGNITAFLVFDSVLTRAEIAKISANPWQVFAAPEDDDEIFTAGGGEGISITSAWTEQGDTVSISAASAATAAASWMESPEVTAIAASVRATATAGWTEATESTAIAASVTASAAIAWSEQPESVSVAASVRVNAAANWSESSEVTAIAGTIGSDTTVSAAWTEAPEVTAVAASVAISATAAWSEAAESTAISTSVGDSIAAGAAWVEASESFAALATVRIDASAGWAEQADTSGFSAQVLASAGIGWAESSETMAAAVTVQATPVAAIAWTERGESFALIVHSESQVYARAPDGNGYSPRRNEYQSRPTQAATSRPPVIQRNNR